MEYFYCYMWEKNDRVVNEDAICVCHVIKKKKTYLLAVVCDGIGGLQEGENASTFVADSMRSELMRQMESTKYRRMRNWRNLFLQMIYQCHQRLLSYGKENQIRLGTTMTMLFICENKGYFFQAGDSALFEGKQRVCIGPFAGFFTGLKRISPIHKTKNGALKQAIGAGRTLKVEWKRLKIRKGSIFLIASDGFYQKNERTFFPKNLYFEHLLKEKAGGKRKGKRRTGEESSEREKIEKELGIWVLGAYQNAVKLGEKDNASAVCILCK